jgi:D-alanyl-D-alanine carboxypeptidase
MLLRRILFSARILGVAAATVAIASARTAASYKGAISIDAQTGAVLFQDNADAISPPASMTKLMTFAVLYDDLKAGTIALDTPVTVTIEDEKVAMFRKSTEVWLRRGETFPVEELIYAMMIQSANDAAYTLAHKAGGTVANFVAQMNDKARELGMNHSTFRSPHGFPPPSHRISDGDLTTPRDYSLLCRYLLLHTDILKYTSVKERTFGTGVRLEPVHMTNHNHLLGKIPGVDGLKTGFTDGAGFCLSATALREGHRIIVVMMDSPDSRTRDLNMQELINEAFTAIPMGEGPFETGQNGFSAPTRPTPAPTASPLPPDGPRVQYPGLGPR